MRFRIIAVGRLKSGPERELVELYRARLESAPAGLGPLVIEEVDERKEAGAIAAALEGAIRALRSGAKSIALDERGEALTTRALAARLTAWRDHGAPEAVFVIGGADGLDKSIAGAAHLVLSLGPMTWPHRLARAMLAEQLYRAASLASGHPYHRD